MNNGQLIAKRFQNHFSLSGEERWLFCNAVGLSAWVRLVTLYLPMKWWYKPLLGEPVTDVKHAGKSEYHPADDAMIKKIRRATSRCKRVVPWNVTCLMESVIQRRFYKKYGINKHIHILVQQKNGELQAHAYVQGGADHHQKADVGQSNFSFC